MKMTSLCPATLLSIAALSLVLGSCAAPPPVISENTTPALSQPAAKQEPPPAEDPTTAATSSCVDLGCPAPDFTLATPAGTPISLNSLKGKKVIVAFVSTRCTSCLELNKCLQQVYANWPREQLEILSIIPREGVPDVERWIKLYEVKNPAVIDTKAIVLNKYKPDNVPGMIFLDGDGVIRAKKFPPFGDCTTEIDSLLKSY